MNLKISREEFLKRSLFLATPVYGTPCSEFSVSMDKLKVILTREGLVWDYQEALRESLIPRARNYLAYQYLASEMTHTLLVDSDIVFEPEDALQLLALASPGSQYDVVCGAYPKKKICWNKVRDAAKAGFADDDVNALEEFVGEFFFRPVDPDHSQPLDKPVEVIETGTGFMMVQRHVFEAIAEAHPELQYVDDFTGRIYTSFFNMPVYNRRLLSEDFAFCQLVRDLGMKVWVLPSISLGHIGTFKYQGNISAMAALLAAKHNGRL